ncbi:uncharacterized protein LOC120163555 [Hibiscus syriacus]|uniref:uncharacterized protein LOC120163555 n=1 Tax=Hibiscus syriacus TaxID=106335 RepID=UPI0019247CCA|nr:uncharacterized protein LOC120163555 [Hibiscus syriacus]
MVPDEESILHIIRDYNETRNLWHRLLDYADQLTFFTLDLQPWLLANICSKADRSDKECPWHFLFVSFVWLLRKRKNKLIFTQGCKSVEGTFFATLAWAHHFARSAMPQPRSSQGPHQVIQWDKPPLGWVSINNDSVELWGLYTCILVVWNYGFDKVLIQSDCLEAMQLVSQSNACADSFFALVRGIYNLCQRQWEVHVKWIPREGNMAADALIKPDYDQD